jgi:uncharacterized protein (TIGR00299 family) protein
MKTLYFDAFSGVSGDMTVGALLALGVPLEHVREELGKLPVAGYSISAAPRRVHAIAAVKFDVHLATPAHHEHPHGHRSFREIGEMIAGSTVQAPVQRVALDIFTKLAEAEGRVHGVAAEVVEFHEVGAVDSIVDIVGTAIGVVWLGVERAYVSPLPLGAGIVQSQHGPLPVPGPATVELLRGFVTYPGDGQSELVTPTGAAIVAALGTPGPPPPLRIEAVGYGAGERHLDDRPNVLRLLVGHSAGAIGRDEMVVIETNIDDYNPELYDYVMERLFAAGARDVYLAPVHMKKNRPGILLSVLGHLADRDRLAEIILAETSAIGVRCHPVQRLVLSRETRQVETPWGSVQVKVARHPDGSENLAPEYDDCKRLARERGVPIKRVYQAALAAAMRG